MDLGQKLQRFLERGHLKAMNIQSGIESKIQSKTEELRLKHEERAEIEQAPMTREELLAHCQEELKAGRAKRFLEDLILPHIKQVQQKRCPFLWSVTLQKDLSHERVVGNYLFGILDDQMLEEIVAQCPDIGMSEADRKKALVKIDREIVQIESDLEKLVG